MSRLRLFLESICTKAFRKKQRNLPVEDRAQEERVIRELSPAVEDESLRSLSQCFIRDVMDVSKQWQRHLRDRREKEGKH